MVAAGETRFGAVIRITLFLDQGISSVEAQNDIPQSENETTATSLRSKTDPGALDNCT